VAFKRIALVGKRIDAHAHYWTDGYLDLLVELGKASTATQRGSARAAARNSTPGWG
jgi:hypothetical protein